MCSVVLLGDPSAYVVSCQTFDAFLTHSNIDQEAVVWLQRFLQRRWLLWMRRRRLCRDQETFGPDELGRIVPGMLASSRHLIVCCSAESARSHWVKREIRYFLRDHPAEEISLCDIGREPDKKSKDEDDFDEFIRWIERRSGRRDLLRPDLRSVFSSNREDQKRVAIEAHKLLNPLTDLPLEVLLRQQTHTWILLITTALIGLGAIGIYNWW